MQLTKQQKVYAAVLGLAVAAFGVDRWVIGLPAAEKFAEVAPSPAPRAPAAARSAGPAQADATANVATASLNLKPSTLASRLEEVTRRRGLDLEAVNDAFLPSTAWIGLPKAAAVQESRDAAQEFLQRHRLTAVMKQTAGGVAIIDQTTVAVGQSFGGFRLVAVKDRSAVLRSGSQRVELRLPDDALPGAGPTGQEKLAGAPRE